MPLPRFNLNHFLGCLPASRLPRGQIVDLRDWNREQRETVLFESLYFLSRFNFRTSINWWGSCLLSECGKIPEMNCQWACFDWRICTLAHSADDSDEDCTSYRSWDDTVRYELWLISIKGNDLALPYVFYIQADLSNMMGYKRLWSLSLKCLVEINLLRCDRAEKQLLSWKVLELNRNKETHIRRNIDTDTFFIRLLTYNRQSLLEAFNLSNIFFFKESLILR